MNRIKAELIPFENRFGKDSRTAWDEFQSGKLGDDGDIMEWMMLFKNYLAPEKHHNGITEMRIKAISGKQYTSDAGANDDSPLHCLP